MKSIKTRLFDVQSPQEKCINRPHNFAIFNFKDKYKDVE